MLQRARWVLIYVAVLVAGAAQATEVAVVGLFPGKAVLVVDGGRPATLAVGRSTKSGVKVVSVQGEQVVVEINGARETLRLGQRVVKSAASTEAPTVNLTADARGHFLAAGSINGAPMRFLVDTGASMVALGRADAERARIDYLKHGRPSVSQTANGMVRTWVVKLAEVNLGGVTLHQVDAAVHDSELPVALLGMSVLNRMEMQRSGDTLTLRKRY
ncbi:MAG TPA: TIGR02281 family clan AA aspartic protease [Denitromonas sp.]|uniref:TIGR02281 family clan AA aspartic protease n=1 Tax=Denitromonas sp. TaxID=2734609 RepID=UPI001DB460C3|nr:TIGR02281 family clan AA aspartic protease [Rhodocyclaceae bacterium]MCP5220907.1 TIGR02281 family clan AA aspartic protease [Zoogloeaceae bacterium]HPR06267.1 TIGR02281 family clan AA aspartic protease [Denitromonas sp.]HQU87201.1 TIGR02281 family clan AA aspartic protease [Denitromonas sp.]HQV13534.1 TIGR02281 family clan AA aspartic protease [Denitromonas sp.]